jgi:hypothetical protein
VPLQERDQIFLTDYIQFNWMNCYIAALGFAHVGGNSRPFALKELTLYYPGKPRQELDRICEEGNECARIQGVMVARLLAEYVAALEGTGAFVRAVGRWASPRGILASNFDYRVADVRDFYDAVLRPKRLSLPKLLGLPYLRQLHRLYDTALYQDVRSHYPMIAKQLRQAARNYRSIGKSRVFKLNTGRLRPSWPHFVHVLVDLRSGHSLRGGRPGGVFDRTYNKVKHGFNVLESVEKYAKLPRKPDAIEVVKLSRTWPSVQKLIANISTMGLLCNRLATIVVRLDEKAALP